MCSDFMKRMDNYQGGDLTDILRTGGGGGSSANTDGGGGTATPEWQFTSNPITYPADPVEDFGDPFAHLRDPLLHDIDTPVSAGFFPSVTSSSCINQESIGTTTTTVGFAAAADGNTSILAHRRPAADNVIETRSRPSNMFSRMLQISPNAKLTVVQPSDSMGMGLKGPNPMLMPGNSINTSHVMIPPNSSKVGNCLVESPAGLQISSPRNTGIKRRKSQAKKVVCIPAPAPANSRPSAGEIVPSDLWAWRKYGQKPIKGSPYPRGYYRCSSSKGCSARKQVERSRTDPNMLVITYTSEHNHPWPTQRNALAGSTRSQPSKSSASKTSPNSSQSLKSTNPKEEQKDHHTTTTENDPDPSSRADAGNNPTVVKEENMDDQDFDNQLEMDNHGDPELNDQAGFPQSYRPTLPDTNQEDSFFADLGEIEADSLDMLFTQGFGGEDFRGNKISGLDQFSFYDWAVNNGNNTSTTTTTSFGEAKKDSLYDDHDKNCKNPR